MYECLFRSMGLADRESHPLLQLLYRLTRQTLCTGQEGLNHLIECFYEECGVRRLVPQSMECQADIIG
jgi:hypothetical protein